MSRENEEIFVHIKHAWIKHKHCFLHGCSKNGLRYWVKRATGVEISYKQLNDSLEWAERKDLIKAKKSPKKFTTYEFKL